MYSIKPGRGPSLMGGVGAIGAAIFGVIWTIGAATMGAPGFFALFGVIFIVFAIVTGIVNIYNATNRNRFSTFDITTGEEESDPIAEALDLRGRDRDRGGRSARSVGSRGETEWEPGGGQGDSSVEDGPRRRFEGDYCPFCGAKVEKDFAFCPNCGKDI